MEKTKPQIALSTLVNSVEYQNWLQYQKKVCLHLCFICLWCSQQNQWIVNWILKIPTRVRECYWHFNVQYSSQTSTAIWILIFAPGMFQMASSYLSSGPHLVRKINEKYEYFDPDRMLRATNLSFTFHTQVKNLPANTSDLKSPRADASFTWKKPLSFQNFLEKTSPTRILDNCLALASCPTTRSSSVTPSLTSMIKLHIRKLLHPTSCPTSSSPWSTVTRAGPLVSNYATISNSLFNIKVCFYQLPLQELPQQCQHQRLLLQYLASHKWAEVSSEDFNSPQLVLELDFCDCQNMIVQLKIGREPQVTRKCYLCPNRTKIIWQTWPWDQKIQVEYVCAEWA